MGFAVFALYLITTFVRPAELYPELAPYRIMLALGGLGLATAAVSLLTRTGATMKGAQVYLVLGFFLWAAASLVLSGWLGGGLYAMGLLLPSFVPFLLAVINLDTLPRLRITGMLFVVGTMLTVAQGIAAFHFGIEREKFLLQQNLDDEEEDLQPVAPAEDEEGLGAEAPMEGVVFRIRGIGFLNDPNDLAQCIVAALPMVFVYWRPRRSLRNILIVLVPAAYLLYGTYLTRSRGGILAVLSLAMLAMQERLGKTASLVLSFGALIALAGASIGGGRGMTLDESAMGRVDAWYEGILMLKSSPIWGVGFGNFHEINRLVAHNSFVHCFAETGLVGYFLWLGALLITFVELSSLRHAVPGPDGEEIARWASGLRGSLVAFLAASIFLSRTYSVLLFLVLGLSTAVIDLARRAHAELPAPGPLAWGALIGFVELSSIAGIFVLVKVLL